MSHPSFIHLSFRKMSGRPPLHKKSKLASIDEHSSQQKAKAKEKEKKEDPWEKLQAICQCVGIENKHQWSKQGNATCPMLIKEGSWCVHQLTGVVMTIATSLPTATCTYRQHWMVHVGNLPVMEMFLNDGGVSNTHFTNKFLIQGISPVWWLHHLHVALALLPYRRRLILNGYGTTQTHPAFHPHCTANQIYGLQPVRYPSFFSSLTLVSFFHLLRMGNAKSPPKTASCGNSFTHSTRMTTRTVEMSCRLGGICLGSRFVSLCSFFFFFSFFLNI